MNDQTRREFLKKCFQIGGYAAIASFGMGAVNDARGWGILPAVVSGGGGCGPAVPWADWDQTCESNLETSTNLVALFENRTSGGDEFAVGLGLSGTDLQLMQIGTVPGATGDPLRRVLDGSAMNFQLAAAMMETALRDAGKKWTVCFHIFNYTRDATDYFCELGADDASNYLVLRCRATKLSADLIDAGGSSTSIDTTNDLPATAADLHIAVWNDNSGNCHIGFTTSGSGAGGQPTKKSDFAAGNVRDTGKNVDFTGGSAFGTIYKNIFAANAAGKFVDCSARMFCISKICLINNAA